MLKASDFSFMSSLHQIEEQARLLSAEDRVTLAEYMLESLHASIEEIDAAWSEEIALRIDAIERELFLRIRQIRHLRRHVRSCRISCSVC
jgi:hypothetical protein